MNDRDKLQSSGTAGFKDSIKNRCISMYHGTLNTLKWDDYAKFISFIYKCVYYIHIHICMYVLHTRIYMYVCMHIY